MDRAFRQIPLDPADYALIGMIWQGLYYFDAMSPMGLRSAAMFCQRTTNSIRFIVNNWGYFLMNYLDDFMGAEHKDRVQKAFPEVMGLLRRIRVGISDSKTVEPTTCIEALGVWLDSESQIMTITGERLNEIMNILEQWRYKRTFYRRELQSLVGKLQFVSKCVRTGRVRLLKTMRGLEDKKCYLLTDEAKLDIKWWYDFHPKFSGTVLMWMYDDKEPDHIMATDACLEGVGGICGDEYFQSSFPARIHEKCTNIANKELLTVLVALKIWSNRLRGFRVRILCDNMASVDCLNRGRVRDLFMQSCLRETAMVCAVNEIWVKAKFIEGISNRIPDFLSRWQIDKHACVKFYELTKDRSLNEVMVHDHMFGCF